MLRIPPPRRALDEYGRREKEAAIMETTEALEQ
jgi:hypothetical protein